MIKNRIMNSRGYWFGVARKAERAEQFAAVTEASNAAKAGDYSRALDLYRAARAGEYVAECDRAIAWLEGRVQRRAS